MNITIYHFDKIKDQNIASLVDYYTKLTGKYVDIELISLKDRSDGKIKLSNLEKYFEKGFNIVLDENGKLFTTKEFASKLDKVKYDHSHINVFLGNAFGFEWEVKQKADLVLSLSPMTTAHELALVFLVEQLFRVLNMNAGGKYHK